MPTPPPGKPNRSVSLTAGCSPPDQGDAPQRGGRRVVIFHAVSSREIAVCFVGTHRLSTVIQ